MQVIAIAERTRLAANEGEYEKAEELYGVIIDRESLQVDEASTARKRARSN